MGESALSNAAGAGEDLEEAVDALIDDPGGGEKMTCLPDPEI